MIAWLTDTLVYTGALIALALLLRRPVARHFGPQMAYALWALPLLRFWMPPVVLPASLAPAAARVPTAPLALAGDNLQAAGPMFHPAQLQAIAGAAPVDRLASAAPTASFWPLADVTPGGVLLAAWVMGAVLFLLWRGWTYMRMREWLLQGARPVGEIGSIRLVESPALGAPVAFGVSDRVIALPLEFMASEDRAARDLAIEHELAHHRGRDLLANIIAQPILALHWFNPLAWLGWRAMRRDQEAACDARVIARRSPCERARYGEVIASFAAGPRLALAAPMAGHRHFGPVLGEKSIIYRLRSLSRGEISARRRLAGRALLAGSIIALPLSASISYADAPTPPVEPAEIPEIPAIPAAPEPPAMPTAAVSPLPAIPAHPPAPAAPAAVWTSRSEKTVVEVRQRGDGKQEITILKQQGPQSQAQTSHSLDGGQKVQMRRIIVPANQGLTRAQLDGLEQARAQLSDQKWAAFGEAMASWGSDLGQWGEQMGKQVQAQVSKASSVRASSVRASSVRAGSVRTSSVRTSSVRANSAKANSGNVNSGRAIAIAVAPPQVDFDFGCDAQGKPANASTGDARPARLAACRQLAGASARLALMQARASVARDRSLDEDLRDELIDSLDDQIEQLDDVG